MKRAAIISCNDNYDYNTRTKYVCRYLEENGYEVIFIVADFDHRNKVSYLTHRNDKIVYIHVSKYVKNISFKRIKSHFDFARNVKKYLLKEKFDLIYHCAPPNSTISVLSKLKENNEFTLITEIGDMWPETMPVSKKIKKVFCFPLYIWSSLRDKYLYNSDVVIAECDLFKKQLENKTGLKQIKTMYFCKEPNYVDIDEKKYIEKKIALCYLGSINNIIDCDMIGKITQELSKRKNIVVHVIGDGEKKKEFVNIIEENGGKVKFYGKVFDDSLKKKIFSICDYALNIMKTDVNVGMTMKSLDYFSYAIPIINNIGGDIEKMVVEEGIGFNINENNISSVIDAIDGTDMQSYQKMKNNVKQVHKKYFSVEKFNREMEKII